jgi:hypothetical protein
MEKKNCKLAITQFEFEIEPDNEIESDIDKRRREAKENEYLRMYHEARKKEETPKVIQPEPKPELEPEKIESPKKETVEKKISEAWERCLETYRKGEKSALLNTWKYQIRKEYKDGKLINEKYKKLAGINFPFEAEPRKEPEPKPKKVEKPKNPKIEAPKTIKVDAWEMNLEAYRRGEKSSAISTWMTRNRTEYRKEALPVDKYEKLMAIDFPFEVVRKKAADKWDKQLEIWKKDKKNIYVQRWKNRSIKQYVDGKLSGDRIAKLKEVGILK